MSLADIQQLIFGAVQGLVGAAVFVLALWIGFCVVVGFPKLRKSGPSTLTVQNLDESLGATTHYLPPDAPRGPSDQLMGAQRAKA